MFFQSNRYPIEIFCKWRTTHDGGRSVSGFGSRVKKKGKDDGFESQDGFCRYYELHQYLKTVEALEKCIPYLSLNENVVDAQYMWLKKVCLIDCFCGSWFLFDFLFIRRWKVLSFRVKKRKKDIAKVSLIECSLFDVFFF